MKKKILKAATKGLHVDLPYPSKMFIPEWYKKAEQFIGGAPAVGPLGINRGPKLCVPYLDALTTGYTAVLWQDVIVSKENGEQVIRWEIAADCPQPAQDRPANVAPTYPIPAGHSGKHFVWKSPYMFQTPSGYSLVITHPFNRFDLPFTTMSGVVDADGVMGAGSIPFYLKNDFEGVIEKGTPIFQVLPFKRDNWILKSDPSIEEVADKNLSLSARIVRGWYKDNQWRKKQYD